MSESERAPCSWVIGVLNCRAWQRGVEARTKNVKPPVSLACSYVALFPCNECAKLIIQSGIREVIYMSNKYSNDFSFIAARRMFDLAGVKYWFVRVH